ncbi:hypothetical protein JD292_03630 [Leucobacter sp. CSA2]|uniref:Excalibur calcium-binding domain-containing protein n=1 Tax=Leucobacter edaphi TaxID=2796472 RepID=A0A934UXQ2_9MICO|nr:hypothetical protein [Leucobacter edaphi]MBK0421172.1 hypothetical protein [Leucobacter edaphi]
MIRTHLTAGDPVTLDLPAGQDNTDRHGRLLRTVRTASGVDIGRAQLEAGNAVARYDSRDGYPTHPNEQLYRSLGRATLDANKRVVTTACAANGQAPPPTVPAPTQQPKPGTATPPPPAGATQWEDGAWYTEYRSCSALKRNPNGNPTGPFNRDRPEERGAYNWFQYGTGFRGDGDGDGLACE